MAGDGGPAGPIDVKMSEAELIAQFPELEPFSSRAWQAQHVTVSPLANDRAEILRKAYRQAAFEVCLTQPPNRTRSIALTHLETSMMYAIKGLYQ